MRRPERIESRAVTQTYRVIVDATEARQLARAMGYSGEYTSGGRPALPRCDHPRWTHGTVTQTAGRHAPDPCADPLVPDPSCPYATRAHSRVLLIAGVGYAVEVDSAMAAREGEVVMVDGDAVVISVLGARELTPAELAAASVEWDGR